MNNQQAFDKAIAGIRGQNYRQSIYGCSTRCAYISSHEFAFDTRCPVGHLLDLDTCKNVSDEVIYLLDRNHKSYDESVAVQLAGLSVRMLDRFQIAHDDYLADSAEAFEAEMKRIAKSIRLRYTPAPPPPKPVKFHVFEMWYLRNITKAKLPMSSSAAQGYRKWLFAKNDDGTYEQFEMQQFFACWTDGQTHGAKYHGL